MGKDKANTVYIDFLGNHQDEVKINNDGIGRFLVHGGSVSVWVKKI
jgi:alpha-amylase